MGGESRAPNRRIKEETSSSAGDDETRMYAKLILAKVRKLEVEVATLSKKCSEPGPRSTSGEVEVVDLEGEGEENSGGVNHGQGHKRGGYDELSRFKGEMKGGFKRVNGEMVSLRKLVESLSEHVMEPESEPNSSSQPLPSSSSSSPPEFSSNVFAPVSDDDSKSELGSSLNVGTNLTSGTGLIKRKKARKSKVGRSEPGSSSSNLGGDGDVEQEQQELTEAMQMTVADEDRTCKGASKKGRSNKGHSGVSGEQKAVKKTRHDKTLRRTAAVPKVLQGNDSTTQSLARGGDSMNLENGSQSMPATSRSANFPEDEAVKNDQGQTCGNTSRQLPSKSSCNSGQRTQRLDLECIFCQKKFTAKSTLEEHILRHIGERPNFCNSCPYESCTKGDLTSHLETHKSVREKGFKCKVCNKCFGRKGNLTAHIRGVHEKIRPFQCEECPKTFTLKYNLKQHMLVHTGEKSHCCGICNRKFSQKSSLDIHIRSHTGERPFKCRVCRKSFKSVSGRGRHERQHQQ